MTVYLTGAGCGGPRWLTAEAVQLLGKADHVIYDRLIHPDILQWTQSKVQLHYVGKRKGRHSTDQEAIGRLLVDLGRSGTTVVRLKGGDPFVFGRGGEEALLLQEHGIPWRYVPGVSAAVAALGSAGVPLTHRGTAETATVTTGHRRNGAPDDDLWSRIAAVGGTRAIYMGASAAHAVAEGLLRKGVPPETSCSAVHWGGWGRQSRTDCLLKDLGHSSISSPSMLAIGAVTDLRLYPETGPFQGLQLAVVRPAPQAWETARALETLGADCYSLPLLKIRELRENWDQDPLTESDWLVFTSPRGARLIPQAVDPRSIRGRIASIGPGTSQSLRDLGLQPDMEAGTPTSHGLAQALSETLHPGETVCFFRNKRASRLPPEAAAKAGTRVIEISAYEMNDASLPGEDLYPLCWDECPLHAVIFGSAALVEAWDRRFAPTGNEVAFIAWGEACAQAVRDILKREPLVMDTPSWEGLEVLIQRNKEDLIKPRQRTNERGMRS